MNNDFFSKTILPLIHFKMLFTRHNLMLGLWMLPVALFDFIVLIFIRFFSGANSGAPLEASGYSLLFIVLHLIIVGVWCKFFLMTKLSLNIRDNFFLTGCKIFAATFLILIFFSIISVLLNITRYLVLTLIIQVGSWIPLLGIILSPMAYLITMMFFLLSIGIAVAGFLFPSGRALSFLYDQN